MAANPPSTIYSLGPLGNSQWDQYASAVGQLYYVDRVTGARTFSLPAGFEDSPNVSK